MRNRPLMRGERNRPASRCDNCCGCAQARARFFSNQPSCWSRQGDSSWWLWIWATCGPTCPRRRGYACARLRSDREPRSCSRLVSRSQDRFAPHRCSSSRRASISPWRARFRIPRSSPPWRARFLCNADADQPSKPQAAPWSLGHEGGGFLCASPVLMLRRSLCSPCCAA